MVITQKDIPWVTEPERVKFRLIELSTGDKFWYADFIRGTNLLKAWEKVERTGKMPYLDKLFLTRMEGYLQNTPNLYIRNLEYPATPDPILKIAAKNGARVYCQQREQVAGVRTFIRLAVCADTTSENNLVMPVLSPIERRK